MRSSRNLVGIAIVVGVLLVAAPVSAFQYNGTTVITCTDFTAAGTGAAILDRDNTGTGQESLRIDVRDGTGTVIFTFSFSNGLGSYAGGLINLSLYTTPPTANPITVTVTSLAGNGLLEQVVPLQGGGCASLANPIPTVGTAGLLALGGLLAAAGIWLLARR